MRATYPIIREVRGGSAESAIEFLRCNSVFFEVGGIAQTTARCPGWARRDFGWWEVRSNKAL